ncbi:citryl-CoA lyase [Rothia sp. AR01]|uniref:citrate synthase (unknown stereospecificity) n=1 Tax=Rothia santali TaxID=2949643 RepID=A0A9X2HFT6_9MICC|nr:citryl-CoA lyase [Rothia santali]MCP3426942.1 citryl-CoA lyase [Rothia santali]
MAENEDVSEDLYWRTGVSEVEPENVSIRGYDLEDLIGLPFGAMAFLLIRSRLPTPAETKVFDALLTGVLDYGLQKPGTAAARYVVSSNPNMQAGLATAALAAGDFSLAPENAARFIQERHREFIEAGSGDLEAFARSVVEDADRTRLRIPGFGHPVFKGVDPRGAKLKKIAQEAGLWGEPARLYEAIHAEFIKNPKRSHFPINDVGILAAISIAIGLSPEESTAMAIIGTLPGVTAHISEELNARKPVRVIPPKDTYTSISRRDVVADLKDAGWDCP